MIATSLVNTELFRRRGRMRPDPALRFVARCPTCSQYLTDSRRETLQTRLAGHHYYAHGVRLTEAEAAGMIDEMLTEAEMARLQFEAGRGQDTVELPLEDK